MLVAVWESIDTCTWASHTPLFSYQWSELITHTHNQHQQLSSSTHNSEGLAINFMHFWSLPDRAQPQQRPKRAARSRFLSALQQGMIREAQGSLNNIGHQKGTTAFPRGIPHLNTPKTSNGTWEERTLDLISIVLKLKSQQLGLFLQLARFLCLDLPTEPCRW